MPFIDNKIPQDQWPPLKSTMPGGCLPCLELPDGTKMGQTKAIMRFLGGVHGYQPKDAMLAYKSDSIVDAYNDLFPNLFNPVFCAPD